VQWMGFKPGATRGKGLVIPRTQPIEPLTRRAWLTHLPFASLPLFAVHKRTRPDVKAKEMSPYGFNIGALVCFCLYSGTIFLQFHNQASLSGNFL